MSIGQQEIWIFAQFDPQANCSYNLCSTLRLGGALDADALEAALRDLCDRHEALRSLPERDGLMQVVRERIDVGLDRQDATGLDTDGIADAIARAGREEVTTSFDLDRGPLIRARLLRFGPHDHLMLLTVHHVIADGWSCGILLRELGALYAARRAGRPADLPPAQQLGDFVTMQRDAGQGDTRQEARDYWVGLYPDGLSRIDFPADRPRPKTRSYAARRFEITLERPFVAGLRQLAKDNGTTLFAALIGGFAAYVARLTGVRDNTIGFSAARAAHPRGQVPRRPLRELPAAQAFLRPRYRLLAAPARHRRLGPRCARAPELRFRVLRAGDEPEAGCRLGAAGLDRRQPRPEREGASASATSRWPPGRSAGSTRTSTCS